ncbi:uncharacterized protein LOC116342506 [Contarinia nasturtii]|uniref:uncharacterized protein LOC116342506 n=1 Tax=Contarinia nasturtii TaxID=265458 RepID=UPI0012D41D73|nr:uncharacterized protein LOC116342506 [Contarinia nasturtii]
MDKQRDIYRKLIVDLFKDNFESSQFVEKCDVLMKESDFETIRDEVEGEYFVKNRGITPYIKAIKYLRAKIEACTAAATLFSDIEDYICGKENIVITKITKASETQAERVSITKRKKQQSKDAQSEAPIVHAECKSPHSCKKCRIMKKCRLDGSAVVKKQQKRKRKNSKNIVSPDENNTEPCKPQYSDISDSETTITTSSHSTESNDKNDETIYHQLPYDDHQYTRICFYGSSINEDASKVEEKKAIEIVNTVDEVIGTISKPNDDEELKQPNRNQVPNLLPTNIAYRFKQNNGLRQIAPTQFTQCFKTVVSSATSSATTVHQAPTIIRPIPRLAPRHIPPLMTRPNPRLFYTPINFSAPVHVLQGSVIHQPVYYVQLYQPPNHQYFTHNR